MDTAADEMLRGLVARNPDATLDELRVLLSKTGGPSVSRATIGRSPRRQNVTLKKSP